jgi:hypothetical protein
MFLSPNAGTTQPTQTTSPATSKSERFILSLFTAALAADLPL